MEAPFKQTTITFCSHECVQTNKHTIGTHTKTKASFGCWYSVEHLYTTQAP